MTPDLMPNRILRDGILTSERVNLLSWPAEVLYRRLHSAVDDFGRYFAKPELVRAACYPLQLDKVGNQDVVKWLTECVSAGLVRTYTVDGKDYLEILDFRQQVRAKDSKFPHPPDARTADAKHVHSNSVSSAHLGVVEDEDEVDRGTRRKRRRLPATSCPDSFEVTEEMAEWAVAQRVAKVRVIPETEKFLDHYRSKGLLQHDWLATWRNWMRKSVEFGERR